MRLAGKIAVVTGGDSGIGKAIAMRLAGEGASVAIDYVGDGSPAHDLVARIEGAGGRAYAVQADIATPDGATGLIAAAVRQFGGLDILVNNAGIERKAPFLETALDDWATVIAVNLTGVWMCSQAAARRMVEQKRGGRIVNVSSIHEDLAMPTNAPYCASKGGVRMLMRTIAVELAPHGITVNDICPGAVDTPMDAAVKRDPAEYRRLLDEIPLRRMAHPDEIAGVCAFLVGDEGAYVTGSSYVIDGGMTKRSGSL